MHRVVAYALIIMGVLVLQSALLPVANVNAALPAEAQCELDGIDKGNPGFSDCVEVYTTQGLTASQYCENLEHGKDNQGYLECLERFVNSSGDPAVSDSAYQATHDCSGVPISIGVACGESDDNPIYLYVTAMINFLSVGVGIIVIIMVSIGGIQYMMAGGNPQATEAAIKRITNALIALVVFIFIWAFMNWLVPGGII